MNNAEVIARSLWNHEQYWLKARGKVDKPIDWKYAQTSDRQVYVQVIIDLIDAGIIAPGDSL